MTSGKSEGLRYSSEERKTILLERVTRDGRVLAGAMAEEFGVSEDSIRRDLRDLAEAGLVQRFHGGAAKLPPASLLPAPLEFQRRRSVDSAAKIRIATAACGLIPDQAVVLLDSSTTVLEFVRVLPANLRLHIVTSAVDIAAAALDHPGMTVVLIGGRLNRHTRSSLDATALDAIRNVKADFCILGACGIDPELTLRADDFEDAYIKGAMMKAATRTILLATADKLGKTAAHLIGPVPAGSTIITETPDADFADRASEAGIALIDAG